MELKLCLFCVALAILQTCSAETIDVILPAVTPHFFQYTLDIDPRDRDYNCIDANNTNNNNNTATFWRHTPQNELTNPLNIYSAYETYKLSGINQFKCLTAGDTYLGSVLFNIQEGGHVIVNIDGIPTTYSSNQEVDVSEQTQNVALTCSAEPGEWQLPSGAVSPSYPVLTLPLVTSQDNNTVYTCKRIIGGDTLLEISVTLAVQLMAVVSSSSPIATETMQSSSSISLSTSIPTSSLSSQELTPPSSSILAAVVPSSSLPASSSVAFQSPSPVSTAVPASSSSSLSSTTTTTTTTTAAAVLPLVLTLVVSLCTVCCCFSFCLLCLVAVILCSSRLLRARNRNKTPVDRTGDYCELPTYEQMEALGVEVSLSDQLRRDLTWLLADSGRQLEIQFQSIPIRAQKPSRIASHPDNVAKNRHPNMVPYDCNRVVLGDGGYINASNIPLDTKANGFIATQGPLRNGVREIWRMIVGNEISCLVQLANAVENGRNKCERYWPLGGTGGANVSGVEVELSDVVEYGDWCRREIVVAGYGTVTQFHFTEWSSGTFPQDTSGFLQMLRAVKETHDPNSPICVVCPDGTERSGVFILLYSALCRLECHKSVSLSELLVAMRQSRARMVQSVEHYKHCHLCLQEMAFGDTSVPLSQLHSFCREHVSGEGSRVWEEFQQLDFVTKRVQLRSAKRRQGDYMNASGFELGGVRNGLLGTQSPTRDTLAAFLQLIWESRPNKVIMLVTPSEYEDIVSGVSLGACYWPEEGLRMEMDNFIMSCLSCETSGGLTTQELALCHQGEGEGEGDTHEFSHLILTSWEESGIPTNYESIAALARQCVPSDTTAPLVVHCGDCVSKSGVFLVGCGAMWQMGHQGKVDVFSLVKRARHTREGMIDTQELYRACYRLAERAAGGSEYENLSSL